MSSRSRATRQPAFSPPRSAAPRLPLQGIADRSPIVERHRVTQMKADARVVQRQEEEELMQGKFLHSHAEPAGPLQREAGPAAAGRQAGGRGLPSGLQAGVEAMSGMSMSDVNVVRDSGEPARVGALAFAEGDTIHLAPGQERHLPHEAWHVVQQRQGRVAPTGEVAGRPLNDDAGLEREADAMGAQAGRRSTAEGLSVKQKNM